MSRRTRAPLRSHGTAPAADRGRSLQIRRAPIAPLGDEAVRPGAAPPNREVLEGGGGEGGCGWDPPPPPRVPLWSPPKAGEYVEAPLSTEGAEANFRLSASNIGRGGEGGWLGPASSEGVPVLSVPSS